MSFNDIVEFFKKYWSVILAVCVVVTPVIWLIINNLYQFRLKELWAKIRTLESKLKEKPAFIEEISLRDKLLKGDGKFEWQWAGQNWIGYIVFTENTEGQIDAELEVHKVFKRQKDGEQTIIRGPQVLRNVEREKGNVILHKDHIELKGLTARKSHFEWIRATPEIEIEGIEVATTSIEILSADNLQPVTAFAGRIKYKDSATGEVGEGDMVLTKYKFGVYSSK